jgi:uncharacterized protein YggE
VNTEKGQTPTVTVTGDAVLQRKPDVAYVTLFLRVDGILLEDAVKESASRTEQIQRALRNAYPEIKDIQLKESYLGEGRPAMGIGRDRANAYPPRPEVSQSLLIVIPPNPELAVKIIDAACRMGCVMGSPGGPWGGPAQLSAVIFSLADPAAAHDEALTAAIADARVKAARLAGSLDKKIGDVLQINVMGGFGFEAFAGRARNPVMPRLHLISTSPDAVEVQAKITVSFALIE